MAVVPEEIEKKTPAEMTDAQVKAPDTVPDDPRFAEVEAEGAMLNKELNDTYDGMLENSDKFYNEQIDATKAWEDKQLQLQQDSTDFAIEKIEQQKAETQKDYVKEQSGAYTDWQKQSNPYGVDAEKKATNGLTNTGYSESSKVAMYNAYQNRVAVARESMNKAMLDFDNDIKEAMLQNNVAKAEIAFQSLQQRLELSLQGFQNHNNLLLDKFNTKLQVKQYNDSRWQSILDNIYREQTLGLQKEQFEYGKAQDTKNNALNLILSGVGNEQLYKEAGLSFELGEALKNSFVSDREKFEYGEAQDTKNNALNLILSGIGNEQLYKEAGLSFELGEALKNSFVSDREKLDLDLADQKLALEREDAGTLLNLAQMGIKVPLTEGLKKMGITQSMLDGIIEKANAVSVSSGGGSGSTGGGKSYSYTNTHLKQLYKDGDYDTFFSALAEKGDVIAEAQALGISAHEVNYLNDKGLTSLEQAKYMLKNHGKEKYSAQEVERMLSGAYTEAEFYGSGHQMSAYDSYEDYLNSHFKKFINF